MIVKSLGHASLFIQMGVTKILMDPWLGNEILGVCRRFPDPGPLNFEIPYPDYIVISHHHWDHVHIPTLAALNKETPVLIPDNGQLKSLLEILEFKEVHILRAWDEIEVGQGCTLIAIPSKVPFGEMGICFIENGNYLINLVDCIFDSEMMTRLRLTLESRYAQRFGICLSPYQSYDEMSVLMRKPSKNMGFLSQQNAQSLVELECNVVIPFADGLYYPGNPQMNSITFLNHPFDFIDLIKTYKPNQSCMVGIVLDEWHLDGLSLKFSRPLSIDTKEILNLYDNFRSYKPCDYKLLESCSDDFESYDICEQELRDFLRDFSFSKFPEEVFKKLKNLGMKWQLIVLGGRDAKFVTIDFNLLTINFDSEVSLGNAWFKIGSHLLLNILRSKELLSVAIQSDRIELGGDSDELAYRSLDVLWYLGLDDESRLKKYVPYQARQRLSVNLVRSLN